MNSKQLCRHILIAALVPLAACASINAPVDGVVIDESTGKPIPSAFVIAQWVRHGSDGLGSRTSCPHLEVVQSDDKGRYRVPEANVGGMGLTRLVFSYKAGYEWFLKDQEPDDRVMSMRPFKGTGDDRDDAFRTFGSLRACVSATESLAKLGPLYLAIDNEARTLVLTKQKPQPPLGFVDLLEEDLQASQQARKKEQAQK